MAKQHAGFRFTPELMAALDEAANTHAITRTELVERWLSDRAVAEGWMDHADSIQEHQRSSS